MDLNIESLTNRILREELIIEKEERVIEAKLAALGVKSTKKASPKRKAVKKKKSAKKAAKKKTAKKKPAKKKAKKKKR